MISPEDMMGFDYYSTLDGKLTLDQYQTKACSLQLSTLQQPLSCTQPWV
jgi:hypothetical protein